MTRKKVKLVWIDNDTVRKNSLKKRRIGMLKKVSEITTLCGVSAFVIIYSPDEGEPIIWPSRPVVEEMLMEYQNIPEMERYKKTMNQEKYLKERVGKVQEQCKKHQKLNRDTEMSYLMNRLHYHGNGIDDFEVPEIEALISLLEEMMSNIRKRINHFQQAPPLLPSSHFPSSPSPPPSQQCHHKMEDIGQVGGDSDGGVQWVVGMINDTAGNNITTGSNKGHCGDAAFDDLELSPPSNAGGIRLFGGNLDTGLPYDATKERWLDHNFSP